MTKRTHDFAALYELDAAPLEHCLEYAEQQHVVAQMEQIDALLKRLRRRLCPSWTLLPLELWVAILARDNCSVLVRRNARAVCRMFRDAVDMSRRVLVARHPHSFTLDALRNVHTLAISRCTDGLALLSLPRLQNLCISRCVEFPADTLHENTYSLHELRLDCGDGEFGADMLAHLLKTCSFRRLVVEADAHSNTVFRLASLVKKTSVAATHTTTTTSIALLTKSSHESAADWTVEPAGVFHEVMVVDNTCQLQCQKCILWQCSLMANFNPQHLYSAIQHDRPRARMLGRWIIAAVEEFCRDVSLHFVDNERPYYVSTSYSNGAGVANNMKFQRPRRSLSKQTYYERRLQLLRAAVDKAVNRWGHLLPVRCVNVVAANDTRGHPFAFPMSLPPPMPDGDD